MSAIAGILFFNNADADKRHLEGMLSSMAHRGPDGCDTWSEGPIFLGHLMLHTTPESLHEHLPQSIDNLAITADARVDNRDELLAQLFPRNDYPTEISDSELILHAYRRWGEECANRIIGDYAFAIWDQKKQQLFCSRDHIGVKPFYYHLSKSSFAFASEPKAILSLPWAVQEINEEAVANYLLLIAADRKITFFKDIYRLPAAHAMKICDGSAKISRYWSLDPNKELKLSSDKEYADAFRKVFFEAVRCRLRSAFPLGAQLSGGMDSSSVVCSASKIIEKEGSRRLFTFSAIFPDTPECDERQYIEEVTSHLNAKVDPIYVRVDQLSPFAGFEEMLRDQGEPFHVLNMYMLYGLGSAARQKKVRILLDGFEGDIVVSHGLFLLIELTRSLRLLDLYQEIKGAHKVRNVPYRKILLTYCLKPHLPEVVLKLGRHQSGNKIDNRDQMINADFGRRLNLNEKIINVAQSLSPQPHNLRVDHYQSLSGGLIQYILEEIDRFASAFSLECRHPFFDRRVMEFCLSLPPEQKLRRGWTRWVLRQGMSGVLPLKIQWRPAKTYMGVNFRKNAQSSDKGFLREVIFGESGCFEDYLNIEALQQAYIKFESDPSKDNAKSLWAPVTLALWLKSIREGMCRFQ